MIVEREIVNIALDGGDLDRPAVTGTSAMTLDAMRVAGIEPTTLFDDSRYMALLGKTAHDIYGLDDVSVFQIWTHLEAMGAEINYGDGKSQAYIKNPILELNSDWDLPDIDGYLNKDPVKTSIECFKYGRKLAGEEIALTGVTSWGPLTTAGHLIGTENLMLSLAVEPQDVKRLLGYVSEMNSEMYKLELASGNIDCLDYLAPGDPSASGDLVSAEMYKEFVFEHERKEIRAIQSTGTNVILHICGNTTNHLKYMVETGASGLSVEEKVDPYEAIGIVDGRCAMVGNVAPITALLQGTPEIVREEALRCKDAGFRMIQPGCTIAPETPAENLKAMCEAIKGPN